MPDPTNKPKAKVKRGPQLKPFEKVVVEKVSEDQLPVVSDANSIKPSDEPVGQQEEETTLVPIFGVVTKPKKPGKANEGSKPEAKPEVKKPAFELKRVDVKKPVAEPPAVVVPKDKKTVLFPPEEEAPKPVTEAAEALAPAPLEEAPVTAKPVEETATATVAPKKSKFRTRPITVPGVKPTLDGYTLTTEEEDALSKLTEQELLDLAKAILTIEKQNPYKTVSPAEGYVPENRRAFTNFISTTFNEFKLDLPKLDPKACDNLTGTQTATMYKYQEFVRDYMRWQSPYRGLLIYHGLGSGKTCSAIAAAEALFSQGNRRIIVLTPASLQENFLKEISFCGFEHFRLNNNWIGIPKNPETQPLIMLFAEKVLHIPKQYLSRPDVDTVWIPDFRKRTATTTIRSSKAFKDLTEKEKQQVREQIENIVFRVDSKDPKKRRYGRIQFISYNGVGRDQLKEMALKADAEGGFDNAVVIIDEVHNLVRNMQGQIDPFLIDLPGKRKKIMFDPVTHERWVPKPGVNYTRGILFYRLLVGAKNSKIIGLSGTPIINFPEEVGILMNILHGYNHIGSAIIPKKATDTQQTLLKLKNEFADATKEFQFSDFFEATVDSERGVKVTVTMLPEGIQKIPGKETVERIQGKEYVDFADRFTRFEAFLRTKKIFGDGTTFTIKSEPLLPPTREAFDQYFKDPTNDFILMKRMSGLVSYYKGSRKDLMPEKTEVVVKCPMSLFAQKYYLELRAEEMKLEEISKKKKKKAQGAGTLSKFWAMAYDIENLDVASSYRVATRQACNFAFPDEVRRPRPQELGQLKEEIGPESEMYRDDLGAEKKPNEVDDEDEEELSNAQARNLEQEAEADEETQATLLEDLQAQLGELKQLAAEGEIDEEDLKIQIQQITEQFQQAMLERAMFIKEENDDANNVTEIVNNDPNSQENYCTAIQVRPDEKYKERIARAMKCLKEVTGDQLVYGSTLPILSTKFEYMIKNILKIKEEKQGSNLIYSNYLSMEGLGIFTMILDMMGWEKIVIEEVGTDLKFSKETIESFAKGTTTPRYIYFTGGEKNKVRKAAINVFNFNLKDLPPSLTKTLQDSGFTDNKQGTLCNAFCITSAGAEGLSLHNVRAVHIMEPHWNDVRMAQVKGRAIRICSHKALAPAERNVTVYTYLTTFSDLTQVVSSNELIKDPVLKEEYAKEKDRIADWTLPHDIVAAESEKIPVEKAKALGLTMSDDIQSTYYVTTDVSLAYLGSVKKETSDRIQKLMKMGAVDCELNFNENKDGTFTCIKFAEKTSEGGDFLYHPNLHEDIERWTKHQFAKVDVATMEIKKETYEKVKIAGVEYILKPTRDTTGKITHYEIYPSGTTEFEPSKLWGTVNANDDGKVIKKKEAFHKKK